MANYKLTYFNAKGRAESARLMFAVAGQEYEDYRIDSTDWPKLKNTFPFEQVPVLTVDGKLLAQSGTIKRFLAKRFNLYGENDIEAAEIDQVCEVLVDFGLDIIKIVWEEDEKRKELLAKNFVDTCAAKHYSFLANLLDKNGGNGFFVGKKLSLADIDAFTYMKDVVPRVPGLTVTEPKLVAHMERIQTIPAIAEWVKKRPVTTM